MIKEDKATQYVNQKMMPHLINQQSMAEKPLFTRGIFRGNGRIPLGSSQKKIRMRKRNYTLNGSKKRL